MAITFHDAIHRFYIVRGTGTNSLEFDLLKHLVAMKEETLYEIFLHINKAYDALYRYRCLDILAGYDVGPRDICLLKWYWDRLIMVVKSGGYYGTIFKGCHRFIQGYPLSITLFNIVVDTMIHHWITVVVAEEVGPGGFGIAVQRIVTFSNQDTASLSLCNRSIFRGHSTS